MPSSRSSRSRSSLVRTRARSTSGTRCSWGTATPARPSPLPLAAHANVVPLVDSRQERGRGLPPGTLTDSAQLIEGGPSRVCVRTRLWSIDEVDASRADYGAYNLVLH